MRLKLFIAGVFCLYLLIGVLNYSIVGTPNNTNDFIFHYNKTFNGYTPEVAKYYTEKSFNEYPNLYHLITGKLLPNHLLIFWVFNLGLIVLLIPFLIYLIAKTWGVIIYFAGVSFPYMAIYSAIYPNIVVIILMLVYFKIRKIWALIPIGVLMIFMHNKGIYLLLIIIIAEIIYFLYKKSTKKFNVAFLNLMRVDSMPVLIKLLLTDLNFWLVLKSFKTMNFFYFTIFLASLSFIFVDFRAVCIAQIVLCVVLGQQFNTQTPNKNYKYLFIILFIFNLIDFILTGQRLLYNFS